MFGSNNIYPHDVDPHKAFRMKFEDIEKYKSLKNKCSSIFLEPMVWMKRDVLGEMTGKVWLLKTAIFVKIEYFIYNFQLHCPHCNDKIGKFHWYGSQCSCGQWVTPSLQAHVNKLDFI